MRRLSFRCFLALGLVVLLVFQLNALTIHEYNLRQQGYQLIDRAPGLQSPPVSPIVEGSDGNFYNIALCETHFLINTALQYLGFAMGMALLSLSLIPVYDPKRHGVDVSSNRFFPALLCRAPPV